MTVPTAGAGLGVVAVCFARCAPGSNGFRGAFAAQWQFQIVLVPDLLGRGGADTVTVPNCAAWGSLFRSSLCCFEGELPQHMIDSSKLCWCCARAAGLFRMLVH